ncbi:MAG: hypothetical protein JWQ81_6156 [Amycolatopsis sp.]|uniref:hypothetical protein n=1 Tax=Amycolatopsis sp. TaxID=37632 RepID=UPI00260BFE04|nr:hypothetical protein [Amycolatopsis sp.]MCU1685417.1 hypothetical protein [Amycolatopsis sp.]
MEHEGMRTPEINKERPMDVFNLGKLTIEQITVLISALGAAYDADQRKPTGRPMDTAEEAMIDILGSDLTRLAEQEPDRAQELFLQLARVDDEWTKTFVINTWPQPLMRHYAIDDPKRQEVIDQWVQLLDDDNFEVQGTARDAMQEVVGADWIDAPTASYLDSKLPGDWQADAWKGWSES